MFETGRKEARAPLPRSQRRKHPGCEEDEVQQGEDLEKGDRQARCTEEEAQRSDGYAAR
jgi:hypothetical protein